jgi:hypothetical protein
MAIDRSGTGWTGSAPDDIEEYLTAYSAEGYPSTVVVPATCAACDGVQFSVRLDDDEGCVERTCASCRARVLMLDSAQYVDDAELESAACPCGGETFNVGVGFAFYDGAEDVHWVYIGLRCVADGALGCYGEWKIGYGPSRHLLAAV